MTVSGRANYLLTEIPSKHRRCHDRQGPQHVRAVPSDAHGREGLRSDLIARYPQGDGGERQDRRSPADPHGVVDHHADGPAGRVHGRNLDLHLVLAEFLMALTFDINLKTIPVGIATFCTAYGIIFAASVVAVAPIGVLAFIFP